jgi:hypothetical protein
LTLATLLGRLRLACKLDRNLAVEDGLAIELLDGTLGFGWGRDVDEGVTNGTGSARVGWDGRSLTAGNHQPGSDGGYFHRK